MANAGACHLFFPTSVVTSSPPSACPASFARKEYARRRGRAMLCRAGGGDFHFDRRDVLAGLTGVAAGGLGVYPNIAVAADDTESGAGTCDKGDKFTDTLLKCPRDSADSC